MPSISVVIPVYNAQDYLERCLESVCNQTLKDIEIICVNDCSTDNSLEILKNYSTKYSNLKVIDCKINGGESVARNIGIDNATGEYLGFIDNDDEVDLSFYEKLYNKAKESDADIVKGEVHEIAYDGKNIYGHLNELIRKNKSKLYFSYHWWTAIYRHSLIKENKIKFPIGYPLGGDVLFLNNILLKAKDISLVDDAFYHYYRREDSGDSKILEFKKLESVLSIHHMILDNLLSSPIAAIDTKGTSYVCFWCVDAALSYAYRNQSIKGLEYCIENAFSLYNKSKDKLLSDETKILPIVMDYLDKNDKEGLKLFYQINNSPSKMFMANLRYLHTRNKIND